MLGPASAEPIRPPLESQAQAQARIDREVTNFADFPDRQ